jgi:hypothetical protein
MTRRWPRLTVTRERICLRFKRDPSSGVFGPCHQSLQDAMVGIGLEASLPVPVFLEQSFGRLSVLALEFRPQAAESGAHILNTVARERLPLGGGGDVDDIQVYTDKTVWLVGRGLGAYPPSRLGRMYRPDRAGHTGRASGPTCRLDKRRSEKVRR